MSRDFEKAKRRDLSRPNYDPIASFKPPPFKRKKHRRFHSAGKPFRPFKSTTPPDTSLPDVERVLTIDASGELWLSRWRRTKGKWRCTHADTKIDWFLRVRHPETVQDWLLKNHFAFQWQRATPVCTAHKPQTEDNPAVAYPPNKAGDPSGVNTVASLNNPSPAALRGPTPQATTGLERTGLATPCRLMLPQTAPTLY